MAKEVKIDISRGHLLEIDGKYYKLCKEGMDEDGRTITKQYYKEINPDTYSRSLWNIARRVEEESPVKLIDIIVDALKDLPLDRLVALEDALMKERGKVNEPKAKDISSGGCVELKIGNEHLVLRE